MTEREKMLRGQWYHGFEENLVQERQRAKELLFDLNQLRPSQRKERENLLQQLLGSIGKQAWIESPFLCDYGSNLFVGENFYANHGCVILDCAKVTIGNDVLIGPQVGLYAAGHPLDAESREKGMEYALPITIGDRVWIGGMTAILAGVTIGENSVIGAGSVVNRDIPPNVVAVGNPCRVIRPITEEDRMRLPGQHAKNFSDK